MIEALNSKFPEIIQGGMGVAISDWKLSKAVALAGEKVGESVLSVVSGTALTAIMVDRLQGGHSDTERALRAFDLVSNSKISEKIIGKYSKKTAGEKRLLLPKPETLVIGNENMKAEMTELAVAAAFVEIWLAKEGHDNPIGVNLLEKIQLPILPTLLGAMMAKVDYVLVGAGIPSQIPKVLDSFANGMPALYSLDDAGGREIFGMTLDPKPFVRGGKLKRPKFFPIISSHILAQKLNRESGVDGFIIEGPLAGGHNAPARGKQVAEDGQPIYGEKDRPDLDVIKGLGKPFYLAGAYASKLKEARELGAAGIQVGTPFALCNESGMKKDLAEKARDAIASGKLAVYTSPLASPSGYPFMVAQLDDTLSQEKKYGKRHRTCKYGFLVEAFKGQDGNIGFRCPAESVDIYVKKEGKAEDMEGRVCLCAGLMATADHESDLDELPIVTLGKDLSQVEKLMAGKEGGKYSAEEVILFIASHR